MTERLSALLHEEADVLRVPPPSADRILAEGRGIRRRRRLTYGAAGLALAGVLGTGIGLAVSSGDDDPTNVVDEPGQSAALHGATFTVGVTAFLDGGAVTATIDDKAVKSSYYTSAGLLVRHGNNNDSDGGGPQRFSLVTPNGTVKKVSVVTEEVVPGVDPAQPYLAYTVVEDGVVQVIVHDVSTDEQVAKVAVPDATEWGGWSGPPVALSGDIVYVGTDDVTRTVNWRTGEVAESDVVGPGFPEVRGGRTIVEKGRGFSIVDLATGGAVYAADKGYAMLSPDGRFVQVSNSRFNAFDAVDLATGRSQHFDSGWSDYGWTPEGDLARLVDGHVETCALSTGDCTTADRTIPSDGGGDAPEDVRFAGQTYES